MTALLIIGISIFILIMLLNSASKKSEAEEKKRQVEIIKKNAKVNTELLDDDNWGDNYFHVSVAGTKYHCTSTDAGFILGLVEADVENEYNNKAMAVYDKFHKKLIGYIPEKILASYRQWSGAQPKLFIGYINYDYDLYSYIKVYKSNVIDDKVIADLQDYMNSIHGKYGFDEIDVEFLRNSMIK